MRFKTNSLKDDLSGRVFLQIIDTEDKHSPIRKLMGGPNVVGEVVDWLNNGMKTDWKKKAYEGIEGLYEDDEIIIDETDDKIIITEIKKTSITARVIEDECDCTVESTMITDWKSLFVLSEGGRC